MHREYKNPALLESVRKEEPLRIREIDIWEEGMPFDRYDSENGFVHATGREYWDTFPGCWRAEYEDDPTVNLPTTE